MLIGEVARRAGVSARMLRHYEELGLVRPTGRTEGGYREYSEEDVRRIFHIESLRSLGLSLREVGRALDDPDFAPGRLVDDLIDRTRERLARETELLTRLRRIGAAGPAGWDDVLRTVALLQALRSPSAGRRQRAALSSVETVPAEALVEAVLRERDPHVAGALRWALARSGGAGLAALGEALRSPAAEVRERAVRALAEVAGEGSAGEEADALLRRALADDAPVVRRHAALALGARGAGEVIPALLDLLVEETREVEAADALGALADHPGVADRIATGIVGRLAEPAVAAPARLRLVQALTDIPGPTAARALAELAREPTGPVALTARYALRLRASR
ncbi:transcriptional regulator [Streptomyces zhaozhouensis]|uniref:Transcriptional regulator n=1 Tax=Streptomyces zhaozhouensis TaxID=1300267 RepID=A0A286DVY6_9ACTN|nr:MerR family transcriptional regulator [Streptomyces zhaozhouensis]SOD62796.1 transcriptional regulator [Streptomyces zhaozhouensis]